MDKTLVCRDCGREFTFTEGEQEFFQSRGYSEPQRCPECRAAKKAARGGGGGYDSYGSGGGGGYSSGGGGYSSGGGGGYGGGRRERTMTTVTCANCGRET